MKDRDRVPDDYSWDKEIIKSEHPKCYGKKIFLNWDKAKHHAKKVRRNHDRSFEAYRCPWCRGIHTGSNDNAAQKGRKLTGKKPKGGA